MPQNSQRVLTLALFFLLAGLLAIVAQSLEPVPAAHAATTWTVQSTADGAATPANCPGVNCRLRDAIAAAGFGDTINFSLTLPATILLTSGEITLTNLTLSGPGANLTISGNNATRIFDTEGDVTIAGLTIRNGNASADNGGAIFNNGNLTLANTTVLSNTGTTGGAIFNSIGTLTLTNTFILSNTATTYGAIFSYGTLVISNTTLTANSASGASSTIGNGGTMTILNSAIYSNTSVNGPAIYSLYVSTVSTIVSSSIHHNTGGAINTNGALTIISSTITSNVIPAAFGGGAGIFSNYPLTVTDSTISNNTVGSNGSGSGILAGPEVTMTLNNVTISNNKIISATGSGGGIYFGGHVANLNNVTITGNSAGDGGGVYVGASSSFNFKNTILARNTAMSGPDCTGTVNSQDYNLIGNSTACTIGGTTTHNQSGDPKLTPLAWLGGPTQTHGLLAGSPALDQIPNGTNGCGTTYTTDQRGSARPQNGSCDIGAFEGIASDLNLPLILK